jgi:hypothetical protein
MDTLTKSGHWSTTQHIGSIEDAVVCSSPFGVSMITQHVCRTRVAGPHLRHTVVESVVDLALSRREARNTILHHRTLELLVQLDKSAPLMCPVRAGPLKFELKKQGPALFIRPTLNLVYSSHMFTK